MAAASSGCCTWSTRDRLEREAGLDLISTAPNVVYRVVPQEAFVAALSTDSSAEKKK